MAPTPAHGVRTVTRSSSAFLTLAALLLAVVVGLASACGLLDTEQFIAYSSGAEGARDIAVIRPDGTGGRIIVGHSADDFAPVWSPDRTRVAFLSDRDGNVEVYVTLSFADPSDPSSSSSLRVTNTGVDESHVGWSSDGKRLAYVSPDIDGPPRIYWLELDNLRPHRLIFGREGETDLAWSPEDHWVAFSVQDPNGVPVGIFLRNPGGVNTIQVSQTQDYAPAWSPDGKWLAFVSERDNNQEIYVVEVRADGSVTQQVNVSMNPADDWAPTWSADGKRVVFISGRNGSPDLFSVTLGRVGVPDGTGLVPLTANDFDESAFVVGPSGRVVFTSTPSGKSDLFVMEPDGTGQRRLTADFLPNAQPAW